MSWAADTPAGLRMILGLVEPEPSPSARLPSRPLPSLDDEDAAAGDGPSFGGSGRDGRAVVLIVRLTRFEDPTSGRSPGRALSWTFAPLLGRGRAFSLVLLGLSVAVAFLDAGGNLSGTFVVVDASGWGLKSSASDGTREPFVVGRRLSSLSSDPEEYDGERSRPEVERPEPVATAGTG